MYDIIRIITNKKKNFNKNKEKIVYEYKYYNINDNGNEINDLKFLEYISKIAVPPAYELVYISLNPKSLSSYMAIDKNGKKQYRYSEHQNKIRKNKKYCHLINFGISLDNIRLTYKDYLKFIDCKNITKTDLLFFIIKLIDTCHFRIGSDSNNLNKGILDIKNENIKLINNKVNINFIGKNKKINICQKDDKNIMECLKNMKKRIPIGKNIFSYYNDGILTNITAKDINIFLKNFGADISSKNFRTWAANTYFLEELKKLDYNKCLSLLEKKKVINNILKIVSLKIFNTPKVCRDEYIIPDIIDLYFEDKLYFWLSDKNSSKIIFTSFSKIENILLNLLVNLKEIYCE